MCEFTQEQIMQNWTVKDTENPLVSVRCITYNHEPYIAQAIDGFLMQKTDFPFEVIIHDDASTDKTADIIREYERKYPLIIKPIYQTENQYSKRNGSIAKAIDPKLKGKYIAFCEGDDYWIDPNKLQMQVDFLEKNPEYGMCYTKTKCYIQDRSKYIRPFGKKVKSFEDLLFNGNNIPTLTVILKTDLYLKYKDEIHPQKQNWQMGDYPMWLWFAKNSRIYFFNKLTAVYRVLSESASHSQDLNKVLLFEKSFVSIKNFYYRKYIKDNDFFFIDQDLTIANYFLSGSHLSQEGVKEALSKMKNRGIKWKLKYYISKSNFLLKLYRTRR